MAAIRQGEVDALVVTAGGRERLFSLTTAETPYRVLVEQMQQGAVTLLPAGRVAYANRRFAELLGLELEQVLAQPLLDWADGEPDRRHLRKLIENGRRGRSASAELYLRHRNGVPVPVLAAVSLLTRDDGEGELCVVVTDLSGQKEAAAVAASERKLRLTHAINEAGAESAAALGDAMAAVLAREFQASRCVLADFAPGNPRWRAHGRHPPSGGRVTPPPGAIMPELLAGHPLIAAEGSLLCVSQPSGTATRHAILLYASPSRRWGRADAALLDSTADRVWAALQSAQSRAELRQSEERFRRLADAIPQLAVTARPDGTPEWFNRRWYEFTGLTHEQSIREGWQQAVEPSRRAAIRERWQHSLDTGSGLEIEVPLRGADGRYRLFLARAVAVIGADGRIAQWIGTCTDITARHEDAEQRARLLQAEREARAEAERVGRMKDEFVATLSHELRTPLHAILGWSHLLANSSVSEQDLRQGLATIERNARVQVRMIEDLLDLSRMISGKMRFELHPLGFRALVAGALETLAPTARAKQVEIMQHLADAPGWVSGDPDRLQQVVWNLLSNAIKFTPAGGRITVRLETVEGALRLTVADTGVGIEPAFLPYVFDRFRQADQSNTRRAGGLGLGLSIVHHLVERHGGTVRAESAGTGQGATFILELPGCAAPTGPATDRTPARSAAPGELCGVAVVYVDDHADGRALASRILGGQGALVRTCASAQEARQLLADHLPDVLVADIGMPDEDGLSLIRSIRAFPRDRGGLMPAAAVTALARPEDRRHILDAGFHEHLPKPIEPTQLVAVVASLARRRA
ncbi:MAG TPA: ATP-binding protein [Terriglobales bacterium]|nr:ATP-binding protein [Terriglobales bacterium]